MSPKTTDTDETAQNAADVLALVQPRLEASHGASWTVHSHPSGFADNTQPFVLGVDEAGRGPVLGPMVYACAVAPLSREKEVKAVGVDDSKKLTEADRERLFAKMVSPECCDWIGYAVTAISPRDICGGMLQRTKYNLNQQAYDTTIALIRQTLKHGVNVTEIYVDTVGKEKPYQEVLEKEFPGIAITVTSKADSKFAIVGAASIFAKVIRDSVMKNWLFSESGITTKPFTREFGSGYPGDPNTKKWLRHNMDPVFGFPDVVRFSWSTAAKMLEKSTASVSWNEDDDSNGNIMSFFKKVDVGVKNKPVAKPVAPVVAESDAEDDDTDLNESDNEEIPASTRTTRSSKPAPAAKGTTNSKRKRVATVDAAASDEESEEVAFVFDKAEERSGPKKVLLVDSGRDAVVFRGLVFSHVSAL
ncbi:Ribonuclease H2 subunit A [Podochytrium sp. JEL0797]|nr:Ribonuclease H2 subunit A [Podochytrium sp. JEL0797]